MAQARHSAAALHRAGVMSRAAVPKPSRPPSLDPALLALIDGLALRAAAVDHAQETTRGAPKPSAIEDASTFINHNFSTHSEWTTNGPREEE